jgi:hypothetical protein
MLNETTVSKCQSEKNIIFYISCINEPGLGIDWNISRFTVGRSVPLPTVPALWWLGRLVVMPGVARAAITITPIPILTRTLLLPVTATTTTVVGLFLFVLGRRSWVLRINWINGPFENKSNKSKNGAPGIVNGYFLTWICFDWCVCGAICSSCPMSFFPVSMVICFGNETLSAIDGFCWFGLKSWIGSIHRDSRFWSDSGRDFCHDFLSLTLICGGDCTHLKANKNCLIINTSLIFTTIIWFKINNTAIFTRIN